MKKEISGVVEYQGEVLVFSLRPDEDEGMWLLFDTHSDLWTGEANSPEEIEEMFGYGYYDSLKEYRSQEGQSPWPWE